MSAAPRAAPERAPTTSSTGNVARRASASRITCHPVFTPPLSSVSKKAREQEGGEGMRQVTGAGRAAPKIGALVMPAPRCIAGGTRGANAAQQTTSGSAIGLEERAVSGATIFHDH